MQENSSSSNDTPSRAFCGPETAGHVRLIGPGRAPRGWLQGADCQEGAVFIVDLPHAALPGLGVVRLGALQCQAPLCSKRLSQSPQGGGGYTFRVHPSECYPEDSCLRGTDSRGECFQIHAYQYLLRTFPCYSPRQAGPPRGTAGKCSYWSGQNLQLDIFSSDLFESGFISSHLLLL